MMYSANFKSDGIESKLSPPAAGGPAPIDLDHLRRYTFGDRGLENEVLSLFLAQIPETMAALRAASTERDWHIAAHTLKGSSRAVGAWQLGDLAATAEAQPRITEGTARIVTFASLQDAISAVQAFILSVYGTA